MSCQTANCCWVYNRRLKALFAFELHFEGLTKRNDLVNTYLTNHSVLADACHWPKLLCYGGSVQGGKLRFNSGTLQGITKTYELLSERGFGEDSALFLKGLDDENYYKEQKSCEKLLDKEAMQAIEKMAKTMDGCFPNPKGLGKAFDNDWLKKNPLSVVTSGQDYLLFYLVELNEENAKTGRSENVEATMVALFQNFLYIIAATLGQMPKEEREEAWARFQTLWTMLQPEPPTFEDSD